MKKRIILSVAVVVLAVMLVSVFVACTPSEEKVEKKFKEEGYAVLPSVTVGDYTAKVMGKSLTEKIFIIWFEDGDEAKEAYEEFKNDDSKDNVCKRGNAVAYGDEKAIDIFKKVIG